MSGDTASAQRPASAEAALPLDEAKMKASRLGVRTAALLDRADRLLVRASDCLNPILVKETRQALKSLQFTITFVLLLVACWVVTIGGVAVIGPRIYYSADGGTLLLWYYSVLAFPLFVVVPYAAFRSLAAEREDNTYELLSITALKPRQIVSGKLASAVVQMAVYFSAITPCVAFTYLLRGVDVPTIAMLLAYTFFASLGLSMVAILLATVSQQRFAQVFVSVALVAFLLWVFFISVVGVATVLLQYNYGIWVGEGYWIFPAALATLYATSFALAYFGAAGMLTFTSENRSRPLRLCMLVQQAAWIGWMGYAWLSWRNDMAACLALAAGGAAYWWVMGALLTAERPGMSQRVKRRLPSSFLGRVFLSWLNPGPASGYLFAVANATTIAVFGMLGIAFSRPAAGGGFWPGADEMFYLLVIGWSYLVAYMGLGMLVIGALRRVAVVTMLAGVLIHFLVLLAGSGIPTAIQLMSVELRDAEYTLLQITNPIWSLKHLVDSGVTPESEVLILIIPAAAVCMLLLNLPRVVRELREVRIAAPPRVLEDEAALHPRPESLPTNPWDEALNPEP